MKKGIYSLEGMWTSSVKDKSTIYPILELMEKRSICENIHHRCATREELVFFLKKWRASTVQNKFPILYLGFHGEQDCLRLAGRDVFTLSELAEVLEDSAKGKVFFFASCDTLDIDKRKIKKLLEQTGAIAAIGYRDTVDWMLATAFELLVLEALQGDKFDWRGIERIQDTINEEYGAIGRKLSYRMVVNDRIHFPRKRK